MEGNVLGVRTDGVLGNQEPREVALFTKPSAARFGLTQIWSLLPCFLMLAAHSFCTALPDACVACSLVSRHQVLNLSFASHQNQASQVFQISGTSFSHDSSPFLQPYLCLVKGRAQINPLLQLSDLQWALAALCVLQILIPTILTASDTTAVLSILFHGVTHHFSSPVLLCKPLMLSYFDATSVCHAFSQCSLRRIADFQAWSLQSSECTCISC